MAYNEVLAERIREALADQSGLTERKMFGGIAFMLNGNMCCGVIKDELMLRVGAERYPAAVTRPHAREMDFTGRPMKGMIMVSPDGIDSDLALKEWIQIAVQFNASLPAK